MPTDTLHETRAAIIDVTGGVLAPQAPSTTDDEHCSIACTLIPCCGTD